MASHGTPDFATHLKQLTTEVEQALDQLLPDPNLRPARLHQAMRYSLQAGGKRLRPILVLAAHSLFGGGGRPLPAAIAIECVHTYSLVHDDLPCMDNDDLRRGRPTAHRAFDEPTALLSGDALLTFAFQLLARHYSDEPVRCVRLLQTLSEAAGSEQLIGGQMEDLQAEKSRTPDADQLLFIHRNKTAAMIRAALLLGAHCAPNAAQDQLLLLTRFGEELGLTFQIVDDILDATADTATLGKTAGKDEKADKTTYVKLFGLEGARERANTHTAQALSLLEELPGDKAFLRTLVGAMLERRN